MKFAYSSKPLEEKILCPCRDCSNRYFLDRNTVRTHCIVVGFEKWYTSWTSHGEVAVNVHLSHTQNENDGHDDIRKMVQEGFGIPSMNEQPREIDEVVQSDKSATQFLKLLKDAETELYEGCEEFTTLSFVVELMHLNSISKWSNSSFTGLLKLLKRAMPKPNKLPDSCNGAFKLTRDLGFSYKT